MTKQTALIGGLFMTDNRRDALLKEYGEVSNNFRMLTDLRFKMLNFLPIATGAVAATAMTAIKNDISPMVNLILSLFGLVVTLGLITYNTRNDQLYNELVGRAASIERYLGLPDGSFAHRPRPWLSIEFQSIISLPQKYRPKPWKVDHGTGVATIYAASIALWLTLLFSAVLELIRCVYVYFKLPHFIVPDPSVWINGIALTLAIGVTYLGWKWLKDQVKKSRKKLRKYAYVAYQRALKIDVEDAQNNNKFVRSCVKLSNNEDVQNTLRRANFYTRMDPATLSHYILQDSNEQKAAHLVALLTDFPPGWIFDCGESRKGL
jgi:hypothetical protein